MRSWSHPYGAPSRVPPHRPALDEVARGPESESIVVSELRKQLASLPTTRVEFRDEEVDTLLAAGREVLRRERVLTFTVLTVLAPPVAAAGLLAGMNL